MKQILLDRNIAINFSNIAIRIVGRNIGGSSLHRCIDAAQFDLQVTIGIIVGHKTCEKGDPCQSALRGQ